MLWPGACVGMVIRKLASWSYKSAYTAAPALALALAAIAAVDGLERDEDGRSTGPPAPVQSV
jgi:hypothetical protein